MSIKYTLPTSDEARRLTKKKNDFIGEELLEEITSKILGACERGQTSVDYVTDSEELARNLERYLEEYYYFVEISHNNPHRGLSTLVIYWGDEV